MSTCKGLFVKTVAHTLRRWLGNQGLRVQTPALAPHSLEIPMGGRGSTTASGCSMLWIEGPALPWPESRVPESAGKFWPNLLGAQKGLRAALLRTGGWYGDLSSWTSEALSFSFWNEGLETCSSSSISLPPKAMLEPEQSSDRVVIWSPEPRPISLPWTSRRMANLEQEVNKILKIATISSFDTWIFD